MTQSIQHSIFAASTFITFAFSLDQAKAIEPSNTQLIDAFDYVDTPAARDKWKPMHQADPEVEVGIAENQRVTTLSAPFAAMPQTPRVSIDRKIALDLSPASVFTLQVSESGKEAEAQISLYFHSDGGWYSSGAALAKPGWRSLSFTKDSFSIEGTPAGWDKIDGIRISIWAPRKGRRDTAFSLKSLRAHWNNTAIILPDPESPEFTTSEAVVDRLTQTLSEIGIGTDVLNANSLSSGTLGKRPLAILPYNPKLDKGDLEVLGDYVSNGGKLFVCYSLPHALAEALGFKGGEYFREEKPGDFAAIQFDSGGFQGLPKIVRQASWNIRTSEPAAHNARVVGHWLDGDGKPTGKAALLVSDRGAYFSHILLGDDPANKKTMLMALLGELNPALWNEAAQNAWDQAGQIGHCQSSAELEKFVGEQAGAAKFTAAMAELSESKSLLKSGQGFESLNTARHAHAMLADAYLVSQPSPGVEARAFWNHSGTGAYPGDWERTAREMAKAGMNMILPNMLWGGVAHYPSDILPRSQIFETLGDQIKQCVDAAHKNGIEVHVWKVNYNLGHHVPKEYVQKLRAADRLQVDVDGEPGDWLNPAHPENFKMELESILEVVRNYDIDGFHFDYIRYPNSKNDFSEYSHKKFEADTGNKVKNWPIDCYEGTLKDAYTDWRCAQITQLVKAVSEQARAIRPGIKISAAVFRDYPQCRQWVAQDWPLWAKEGYVDFLCPMDYTDDDEKYTDWITAQKKLLPTGFPLYPGIGVSLRNKTQSADRVVGQIYLNRKVGTGGFTIFNLDDNTLPEVARALSLGAGKTKAIPPHRVENQ
jgi:uncharacterized lipoprotein YddW (UPF0748 family)